MTRLLLHTHLKILVFMILFSYGILRGFLTINFFVCLGVLLCAAHELQGFLLAYVSQPGQWFRDGC